MGRLLEKERENEEVDGILACVCVWLCLWQQACVADHVLDLSAAKDTVSFGGKNHCVEKRNYENKKEKHKTERPNYTLTQETKNAFALFENGGEQARTALSRGSLARPHVYFFAAFLVAGFFAAAFLAAGFFATFLAAPFFAATFFTAFFATFLVAFFATFFAAAFLAAGFLAAAFFTAFFGAAAFFAAFGDAFFGDVAGATAVAAGALIVGERERVVPGSNFFSELCGLLRNSFFTIAGRDKAKICFNLGIGNIHS
jgi:hypothetical protein